MKTSLIPALLLIGLGGCDAMHSDVAKANENLYQGGAATRAQIAGMIYSSDGTKVAVQAPDPQRFCYNIRADILCYDQPRPDLSNPVGQLAQGYGTANPPRYVVNGTGETGAYVPNPISQTNLEGDSQGNSIGQIDNVQPYSPSSQFPVGEGSSGVRTIGQSPFLNNSGAPQPLIDR